MKKFSCLLVLCCVTVLLMHAKGDKYLNIRKAARVIVLDSQNRILLMKINPTLNAIKPKRLIQIPFWLTPGGGVQKNETVYEAAARELYEETGITGVEISKSHIWYGEIVLDFDGHETFCQDYFFLVRVQENIPITTERFEAFEKEIFCQYKWWSIDQMAQSDDLFVPHGLIPLLEQIIAGNDLPKEPVPVTLITEE